MPMLWGAKAMIAGCIPKISARSCGGCERRRDCSFIWPEALGPLLDSLIRGAGRAEPGPGARRFLSLVQRIGETVRANGRAAPVRREVERIVEPLLASGDVRADRVARALGYSRQTLYRRLKEEGATFEQVVDALRRRLARKLLRDSEASIKEIGYRLGFSDPAAFSRAYKRWTGHSPSAERPQAG